MRKQYNVLAIVSMAIVILGACAQEAMAISDAPENGVMPLQNEDVLWVSSVPLGVDVFVINDNSSQKDDAIPSDPNSTKKNGPAMSMHSIKSTTTQHEKGIFSSPSIGRTPLAVEVPDGNYIVGVQLDVKDNNIPWKFAAIAEETGASGAESTLIDMWKNMEVHDSLPAGEIGHSESGTGYLNDGNQELWAIITDGLVRKIGKTYKVKKEAGKAATVITLFQRKDEDAQDLYKTLPNDYKFRRRILDASIWEVAGVPRSACDKFHERLTLGGKALYLGKKKRVMCELTPLDHTVPSKRKVGGFTMRWVEESSEECDK